MYKNFKHFKKSSKSLYDFIKANPNSNLSDVLGDFVDFLDAYISDQVEGGEALSDATSANALSAALREFRSKEDESVHKNFECNINEIVSVKLTDHGRKIVQDQYAELKLTTYKEFDTIYVDADGWSEWPLWELMNLFGEHLYNGAIGMPFKDNLIKFSGDYI